MFTAEKLPSSVKELQQLCLQLQSTIAEKEHTIYVSKKALADKDLYIEHLEERLSLLLSQRYQARSEQLNHLQAQLFDESELEQAIQETRAELEAAQAEKSASSTDGTDKPAQKAKPKREALPAHVRRLDITIDVSDEDKQMMGDDWSLIDYDSSEQLAVHSREYYVKRYLCAKYVLNETRNSGEETADGQQDSGIKVAPRSAVILPKSLADASLLADVIAGNFIDALSFYRKLKILEREGINIGYSTICDWPIQLYQQLQPIKRLLYEGLAKNEAWHLDETVLQVLKEPNRKNTSNSYLWGIRSGPPGAETVLFHYDSRRSYAALHEWLSPYIQDFRGVIVSDEHKPYNNFARDFTQIKAHGGCWFHLRKKFADAAKGRKNTSDAHKVLVMIAALYRLERKLNTPVGEQKREARQLKLKPQMLKIKQYLDQIANIYTADGLMRTAIYYALNNWHKFIACLDHPELPLDNNIMEQAIRPFTTGRRNWLFAGGRRGAEASAFMYSLVATAKACGWEPKAYLETLFVRYPMTKNEEERRALFPMFLKPSK